MNLERFIRMESLFTKLEKKILWDLAEKYAGVAPGQKQGRWTHEDRVAICYAVMCKLIRLNENKKHVKKDT